MIKDYCTGVQHIGIPTNNIDKTKRFFADLGFSLAYATVNDGQQVAFLQLGNLMIETWESEDVTMHAGAIDHISIDVKGIDELFRVIKAKGYKALEGNVCALPIWEYGVSFFTIEGPNKEKIEFCERL